MISDKEKLEEELKLLKESLDLKVITPEEYDSAKARIDVKLKELDVSEGKKEQDIQEEETREEPEPEDKKEEQEIEIKELKEEDIEKEPIKEEAQEQVKEEEKREVPKREEPTEEDTFTIDFNWLKNIFRRKEPVEEEKFAGQRTSDEIKDAEEKPNEEIEEKETKVEEVKAKEEVRITEEKPEAEKEEERVEKERQKEEEPVKEEIKVEEEKPEEAIKEETVKEKEFIRGETKNNKKLIAYAALILILVGGTGYLFFTGKSDASVVPTIVTIDSKPSTILIACSSDKECTKEGSIGTCKYPGKKNAECEYIKDIKVKLKILNNGDCFNCGTERVLSIIKGFFPNLDIENINLDTEEGNGIITKLGIKMLPAYILNSSLEDAYNYDLFSSSFNEVNGNFIMKNTVANSKYYLNREEMPNKLNLFVKQGHNASSKAEDNLKEFLEVFEGKVEFEKYNEDSEIVEELGINTFPIFLVNNKIKFDGVQPADKIRENFCRLNSITECVLGLSKSLV
jgi:chemotaxis protein histidine kinase CheA